MSIYNNEDTEEVKIDEGGEAVPEAEEETKTAETTHSYKIEEQNRDFQELIKRKSEKENKAEIKKLMNKIGERYMQLHGQERLNPNGKDRLGKNAQYYLDIFNGVSNNTLFDGNIDNQLQLLRILASPESEVTGPEKLTRDLAEFEYKMRKSHL